MIPATPETDVEDEAALTDGFLGGFSSGREKAGVLVLDEDWLELEWLLIVLSVRRGGAGGG